MARPVKKRTTRTYQRDIEALGRLRTAIIVDGSLDYVESTRAIAKIDELVSSLVNLTHAVVQKSA